MKKGFTLVELSIVLVIIGLLTGGILAGKSLIFVSRINGQIKQFSELDVAIDTFKQAYQQRPGDSDIFEPKGDNNGRVQTETPANCSASFSTYGGECINFWKHLSDAEMLPDKYTNTAVGSPKVWTPGVNAPKSVLNSKAVISFWQAPAGTRQFLYLHNSLQSEGWGAVTAQQAQAIDKKLDDGLGYGLSGNLKTVYNPGTTCAGSGGPTSGPYDLTLVGNRCTPAVEIGMFTKNNF